MERLAFGEGVEVATENMTSGNNVLKSMYSPFRMHCCNVTGTGGRDCEITGARGSAGLIPAFGDTDDAVDNASSLGCRLMEGFIIDCVVTALLCC